MMNNNIIQIARNPSYCCDYWEWYEHSHKRCIHLEIDEDTLDFFCKEGIPLDEDQFPPEMECYKRVECDKESILSEITFSFPVR